MAREVAGADGIQWSCLQAYAGLDGGDKADEKADERAEEAAARAAGGGGGLRVVCTPSGGARSVSLELPSDWETAYSDEQLLAEIESRRDA